MDRYERLMSKLEPKDEFTGTDEITNEVVAEALTDAAKHRRDEAKAVVTGLFQLADAKKEQCIMEIRRIRKVERKLKETLGHLDKALKDAKAGKFAGLMHLTGTPVPKDHLPDYLRD